MHVVVPEEFKFLYVQSSERPVVKIPADILRQKSTEIGKISKRTLMLVDDMIRIMKKANGVGLAAPQLGFSQRLFVMSPEGMKPTALINPKILKVEGSVVGEEGCLSIPGLYGDVIRAEYVEVEAQDRRGRELVYEFEGMHARVALHEIDHLDGVLFIDKVDPSTLHWMNPETIDDM